MQAQDLMSHPAVTCHVSDPLTVPAHLMWEHDCGAIPVVREDGKLAGMITDRDICMAAFTQSRRLDEIVVGAVMSKDVISVQPYQRLDEIEQRMTEHQVRRIPVVDSEHRPIGVVSVNDLAIESAQPDTRMTNGPAKVVRALAAICQPRVPRPARRAAADRADRAQAAPDSRAEDVFLR
jgi:CBS domain-containing protein